MKKETFIPLNMNLRKGQRAYYNKPNDKVKMTPLVRLLAMAYIYEQRLKENPDMSQKEFCELNNISPRYLRGILQFNFLSPAIKRKIINGWMPKQTSIQELLTGKIKLLWTEQENEILNANAQAEQLFPLLLTLCMKCIVGSYYLH